MIGTGEGSRATRAAVCLAIALALSAFAARIATAAPADLAQTFGTGGIARLESQAGATQFPGDASARMAIGPEDEIFVLYSNYAPCSPPFGCTVELAVARFDAAGKRDASFGVGPGSQLEVRQFTERAAFDLSVGPDGKPVVVASDQVAGGATVARFDLSGHLDGTFGLGGRAGQPFRAMQDTPLAVAVQPDGKIVVAGEGGRVDGGQELRLARYQANGEPDPGFGTAGEAVVTLPTQTRPADLLLDPSGSITVPGPVCCVGGTPFFGDGFSLARVLGDGRPDTGLAGTGQLFFPTPGVEGAVEAAAPAPGGGTFVVFEESTETVSTVDNVVKLLPDGSVDPAFGNGGRLRTFYRVGAVSPSGLAVDGEGRLIVVGRGDGRPSVFRLRPDGSTDRTFNGGLHLDVPYGSTARAVGLQSSGRIVVLGGSGCCTSLGFALIGLRGGTDSTRCLAHKATIVGTQRADDLTGTPHRDVIAALGGKDEVHGLSGADLICGGKGHDRLLGGPGRDQVRQ